MEMCIDFKRVEVPTRYRLTKAFLERVPREFRGDIWDDQTPGLFVRFKPPGWWWFFRLRDWKGRQRTFGLGYGWSPTQIRNEVWGYKGFYESEPRDDDQKCNGCNHTISNLYLGKQRRTYCYDCEIRFRARRMERARHSMLNALHDQLNGLIETKESA